MKISISRCDSGGSRNFGRGKSGAFSRAGKFLKSSVPFPKSQVRKEAGNGNLLFAQGILLPRSAPVRTEAGSRILHSSNEHHKYESTEYCQYYLYTERQALTITLEERSFVKKVPATVAFLHFVDRVIRIPTATEPLLVSLFPLSHLSHPDVG